MMTAPSLGSDHPDERRARIPVIREAINQTLRLVNAYYPGAVSARDGLISVVTANCYFLLSNAYKRARLVDDSRTYNYKVAAMTAAAIMTVRPIRFTRQVASHEDLVRFANWDCATRASLAELNVTLNNYDPEFLRRFHRATLGRIYLPCLSDYNRQFDNLILMKDYSDDTAFEIVERAIPFPTLNNIDIRGHELVQIEQLINIYQLLRSFGAPQARIDAP